ncbi:MAG: transcription elongation factor Spt5 [Candidatus Thermoplasmatota archaeon]|nr:transcription elongation factor Spt5 [Candidatus Thermoplasmatota archaeon]
MSIQEYEWIECESRNISSYCGHKVNIPVTIRNIEKEKRTFRIELTLEFKQADPSIIWEMDFTNNDRGIIQFSPEGDKEFERKIELDGHAVREMMFTIDSPKGGSIDDSATVRIRIASEDGIHSANFTDLIMLKPVIIAVKTNVGKELEVATNLINSDEKDMEERSVLNPAAKKEILAIMSPYELRGYFYLETMHPDRIPYIGRSMRNFKGVVEGAINIEEIKEQLTPKPAVSGLELGSFIELVKGPFKGEKARIMNIDHEKEEVTVQFIESAMLIPVKVKAEDIRVIESGKKQ